MLETSLISTDIIIEFLCGPSHIHNGYFMNYD